MYLKPILVCLFISKDTVQLNFPKQAISYALHNQCDFNLSWAEEIIFYIPTVKYIMNIIKSPRITDNFYEMYSEFIDKFGPRPSGSQTLERAIDYMINLTLESGLHDVITENVTVPHWKRGYESLKMILPRAKKMSVLGLGPSVPTPPVGITGEVIVINSFEQLEENALSIRGKIVLFNSHYTSYDNSIKYRSYCVAIAGKMGAIAVLIRSITPFSLYTPHTGFLYYTKGIKKIPAAAITLEDADLLERVFKRGERIIVHLKMLSKFDLKESRNTIIDLKGNRNPEKFVIVSGHIDSWDVGRGAIDNGGGMMISWFVPVILRYLSLKPKRTIRSILWTAQELGNSGAVSYFKDHINSLSDIDFIMESDDGTFEPLGLEVAGSHAVKCLMANILKIFAPIDKLKDVNITGSSIALFVEHDIPGASLLNKNNLYHWYRHTNADTLSAQNKTHVVHCAAFWAAISYIIADLPFEIPRE